MREQLTDGQAQRVTVNGWWSVVSGVLQGFVLGSVHCNDLNTKLEGILSKLAGDTNLGGTADSQERVQKSCREILTNWRVK